MCQLALGKSRNEENSAIYKKIKIKTNVAIHEAKLKAFKQVFHKLDSKEEKDIYRKIKRKQTNNISAVKCIKDKDKNTLVQDKKIND